MICIQNETLHVVWAICLCWLVVIPSSDPWCHNAYSKAMHSAVFVPFVGNFKIYLLLQDIYNTCMSFVLTC